MFLREIFGDNDVLNCIDFVELFLFYSFNFNEGEVV